MDPKYEQSSKEERDDFALMHHSDRVKKALSYIRAPVKAAVARYFYNQDVFNVDEDDAMLLSDHEDNNSQL
ncbi:hypothetical protein G6F36_015338 [Rhizopus arrhizus]|nr:hypothetical protein G6F36_015338 [Rhizopus arrhizus]